MERFGDTILVADDDPNMRKVLADRLEFLGYRVLLAADGKETLRLFDEENAAMLLLDIEMPEMNGLDLLREIRRRKSDVPVVMITAFGSIDRAVEAMKEGAYDFITKPLKLEHLTLTVEKAVERQRLRREVEILSEEMDKRYQLIAGTSGKMTQAVDAAKKAAASKSTVLLLGESGTGKELFARAIHNWSERKDRPFIAINCVGLSKELLESELFGHEKGAFTGAHQLKKGKMELAQGGTVFLDEVGDMSHELQTKLLRFLQEREFERVGGTQSIHVDVRVIAATNRNLEVAIADGSFRADLYYRLNVVPITLPPLRERKEDIPGLVDFFAKRFSQEAKKASPEVSPEAMDKLLAYHWPGNVRELANLVERSVVLGQDPAVQLAELTPPIADPAPKPPPPGASYHAAIDGYRREVIVHALAQTQGNRAAAARILGLERSYLLKLMRHFDIH
jgi:two-component system, NtrC family, response regulator AtoC